MLTKSILDTKFAIECYRRYRALEERMRRTRMQAGKVCVIMSSRICTERLLIFFPEIYSKWTSRCSGASGARSGSCDYIGNGPGAVDCALGARQAPASATSSENERKSASFSHSATLIFVFLRLVQSHVHYDSYHKLFSVLQFVHVSIWPVLRSWLVYFW